MNQQTMMNKLQRAKWVLVVMLMTWALWPMNACAGEMRIAFVEKSQAKYDTPEAALTAFFSAYMAGDLVWHYETMTVVSAEQERKVFAANDLSPLAGIETFRKGYVEGRIDKKFNYADAIVLVVRIRDVAGNVSILPYTLILEEGKWKVSNKYADSEALQQYVDFEAKHR